MLDAKRPGLRALGCFFETEGGVMLTPEGERRLLAGEPIRIASPVSAEPTDAIAREILRRHVAAKGGRFAPAAVTIVEAGFRHLDNLKAGFDGAWLCFHNFEVVGAAAEGLPHVFVSTAAVGLPNFSALELFTSHPFAAREPGAVAAMQEALAEAIALIRRDPDRAGAIWRRRSGEQDSPLLRAILADTLPRFVTPIRPDPDRWRDLFEAFRSMGFAAITAEEYAALFG
ncbi:MAG: ABC transporter substrate-binding protein [Acetobacteraceae bacterium]|nr:ABC transporter substrate-binding protein [Acetobacteraceae bacterium]